MDMLFDFDQYQGITNVRFDGLDGSESVTSVKDALNRMKVRNPATTFAEAVRQGAYDKTTDEEYTRMLATVEYLSSVWRYTDEPGEAPPKYEMNALMLLANALERLSQLNALYQMPFEDDVPTA